MESTGYAKIRINSFPGGFADMHRKTSNTTLELTGITFSDCQRIDTPPLPGAQFVNTVTILETRVRRISLHTDFLLSYVPLRPGALTKSSTIGNLLVPYGSIIPHGHTGGVYWLPPLRAQSPAPSNTFLEKPYMTIWHYVAIGLMPPYLMDAFMKGVGEAGEAELHRDLWEFSGEDPDLSIYTPSAEETTESITGWLCRLPESDQKRILRYRSPLELCLLVGEPLFADYELTMRVEQMPGPVQEMVRWSMSLTRSRRLSGRNGLG
jgi:hypothetical protein